MGPARPEASLCPFRTSLHLLIGSVPDVIAATVAHAWIRAFCNIVSLTVRTNAWHDRQTPLVPLHTLSSTLKSLRLVYDSIPPSEVFGLICSFTSLEDLALTVFGREETEIYALPSTSLKFTGTLSLAKGGVRFDIWRLLALPGGLHFTKILVGCLEEDFGSITDSVSACRNTLEIICIIQYLPDGSPISAQVDFSKAKYLKEVVFQAEGPSVGWISTALQTVRSKNLRGITVCHECATFGTFGATEESLPELQDLDRLLVQFWTSHSIRLNLVDGKKNLKDLTPTLFPELTKKRPP